MAGMQRPITDPFLKRSVAALIVVSNVLLAFLFYEHAGSVEGLLYDSRLLVANGMSPPVAMKLQNAWSTVTAWTLQHPYLRTLYSLMLADGLYGDTVLMQVPWLLTSFFETAAQLVLILASFWIMLLHMEPMTVPHVLSIMLQLFLIQLYSGLWTLVALWTFQSSIEEMIEILAASRGPTIVLSYDPNTQRMTAREMPRPQPGRQQPFRRPQGALALAVAPERSDDGQDDDSSAASSVSEGTSQRTAPRDHTQYDKRRSEGITRGPEIERDSILSDEEDGRREEEKATKRAADAPDTAAKSATSSGRQAFHSENVGEGVELITRVGPDEPAPSEDTRGEASCTDNVTVCPGTGQLTRPQGWTCPPEASCWFKEAEVRTKQPVGPEVEEDTAKDAVAKEVPELPEEQVELEGEPNDIEQLVVEEAAEILPISFTHETHEIVEEQVEFTFSEQTEKSAEGPPIIDAPPEDAPEDTEFYDADLTEAGEEDRLRGGEQAIDDFTSESNVTCRVYEGQCRMHVAMEECFKVNSVVTSAGESSSHVVVESFLTDGVEATLASGASWLFPPERVSEATDIDFPVASQKNIPKAGEQITLANVTNWSRPLEGLHSLSEEDISVGAYVGDIIDVSSSSREGCPIDKLPVEPMCRVTNDHASSHEGKCPPESISNTNRIFVKTIAYNTVLEQDTKKGGSVVADVNTEAESSEQSTHSSEYNSQVCPSGGVYRLKEPEFSQTDDEQNVILDVREDCVTDVLSDDTMDELARSSEWKCSPGSLCKIDNYNVEIVNSKEGNLTTSEDSIQTQDSDIRYPSPLEGFCGQNEQELLHDLRSGSLVNVSTDVWNECTQDKTADNSICHSPDDGTRSPRLSNEYRPEIVGKMEDRGYKVEIITHITIGAKEIPGEERNLRESGETISLASEVSWQACPPEGLCGLKEQELFQESPLDTLVDFNPDSLKTCALGQLSNAALCHSLKDPAQSLSSVCPPGSICKSDEGSIEMAIIKESKISAATKTDKFIAEVNIPTGGEHDILSTEGSWPYPPEELCILEDGFSQVNQSDNLVTVTPEERNVYAPSNLSDGSKCCPSEYQARIPPWECPEDTGDKIKEGDYNVTGITVGAKEIHAEKSFLTEDGEHVTLCKLEEHKLFSADQTDDVIDVNLDFGKGFAVESVASDACRSPEKWIKPAGREYPARSICEAEEIKTERESTADISKAEVDAKSSTYGEQISLAFERNSICPFQALSRMEEKKVCKGVVMDFPFHKDDNENGMSDSYPMSNKKTDVTNDTATGPPDVEEEVVEKFFDSTNN